MTSRPMDRRLAVQRKPLFILYDGRARGGYTSRAAVMDTAGSERTARHLGETMWKGYDAVWFEYDRVTHKQRIREDLPPLPGKGPKR